MTRLMFWNIEKFGFNKVTNVLGLPQVGGALSQAAAASQRLALIIRMVQRAAPDILVVAELATGAGADGTPVSVNGQLGAWTTLINMQWAHNADWRLVPPLRISNREGMAVFYRSTNLIFSGPYRWPGGGGPAASPAAGGPAAAYPWPLDGLIGQRKVPPAAAYNGGAQEEFCAAQTTGWTPFPVGPMAQFEPRQPYRTTFAETNAAGFVRDISICSVHAPANEEAPAYLNLLSQTGEIVGPSAAPNEVRIIAGDFNVNLLENAGPNAGALNPAYNPLLVAPAGYALGLTPAAVPAGGFPLAGRGYYATHMKRRQKAKFWPPNALYPGYGYISGNLYALDNILVRGGVGPPNFTILNPVVGSPLTARAAPAEYAPPTGNPAIAVARQAGLPTPPPGALPTPPMVPTIGQKRSFVGWNNFGRIRSTSDHLPIVIDV